MKSSQLSRILNLVRRTGDKFVILDQETDEAFSVMRLSDYERLLDGTSPVRDLSEEEIWEKVDRDLNEWRVSHPFYDGGDWENEKRNEQETDWEKNWADEADEKEEEIEEIDEANDFSPEPEETNEEEVLEPQVVPLKQEETPLESAMTKEEDLSDVPEDEEEKFYLEPVE